MASHFQNYYTQQSRGNLPGYYIGPSFQKGHGLGGIFSSIYRAAVPLFRMARPIVQSGAKELAKEAITAGAKVATDALRGEDWQESASRNANVAAQRLVNRGAVKLGSMLDGKKTTSPVPNKRRKTIKASRRKRRKDIFD